MGVLDAKKPLLSRGFTVLAVVDLTARFLNFVPPGQEPDSTPDVHDLDGLEVQGPHTPIRRIDRVDQQQALKFVASYLDGLRVSQLAAQFGVHGTTVRAHLRRAGVELRPFRKLSPDQIVEVRQLHTTGVPQVDLATQFGVTITTIHRLLTETGPGSIPPPGPSTPTTLDG